MVFTSQNRQPRLFYKADSGFTLIEVTLAIAIAGILAGLAFVDISRRLQEERLLTITKTLAAWLDERRRQGMAAMEQVGTGACAIEIKTTTASLSAANQFLPSPLPSNPNTCRNPSELNLRNITSNSDQLLLSVEPTTSSYILFTFRGTSPTKVEFKLELPGLAKARCVYVTEPLGLIRMGSASPPSAPCNYSMAT